MLLVCQQKTNDFLSAVYFCHLRCIHSIIELCLDSVYLLYYIYQALCAQYCFMVTVEQSQQSLVLIFLCWFGFARVFVVHYWMYLGLCAWRPEDSL